jgi:cold shock protein
MAQIVQIGVNGTKLDGTARGPSGDGPRRYVDVANGTIKRLVRDRGFGFIRDDGGQEWFFHRSSVTSGQFEQLNEGQRVSFDEEPSAKGPRAGNIRSEG